MGGGGESSNNILGKISKFLLRTLVALVGRVRIRMRELDTKSVFDTTSF